MDFHFCNCSRPRMKIGLVNLYILSFRIENILSKTMRIFSQGKHERHNPSRVIRLKLDYDIVRSLPCTFQLSEGEVLVMKIVMVLMVGAMNLHQRKKIDYMNS